MKYFNPVMDLVSIEETNFPSDNMVALKQGQSELAMRYRIIDSKIVDMYPGKSDAEVIEEINSLVVESKPEVVIPALTPRQVQLALYTAGLLDKVEALVATDKVTEIWWSKSQTFLRNEAVLLEMAEKLGLTSEQLDEMFIEASKL